LRAWTHFAGQRLVAAAEAARRPKGGLVSSPSTGLPTTEGPGSVSGVPNLAAGFTDTFSSRYIDTEFRLGMALSTQPRRRPSASSLDRRQEKEYGRSRRIPPAEAS
jgi:hypothetical protein